jgi:DNA-directed RNA polymerase subunit omega
LLSKYDSDKSVGKAMEEIEAGEVTIDKDSETF